MQEKLIIGCFIYVLLVMFIVRFVSTNERQSEKEQFKLANDWQKQKEIDCSKANICEHCV